MSIHWDRSGFVSILAAEGEEVWVSKREHTCKANTNLSAHKVHALTVICIITRWDSQFLLLSKPRPHTLPFIGWMNRMQTCNFTGCVAGTAGCPPTLCVYAAVRHCPREAAAQRRWHDSGELHFSPPSLSCHHHSPKRDGWNITPWGKPPTTYTGLYYLKEKKFLRY